MIWEEIGVFIFQIKKTISNMETENIEQVERVLSNVDDYIIKELTKIHGEVLEKMMIEINRLKFGGNEKIHLK